MTIIGKNTSPGWVNPFWLLTLAVVTLLTLPVLIQDGMFSDAILYTSVSHNLSRGIGTFWFPVFDKYNVAGLSSFHEQPPLVFYIQSLFFKLLGSSMYTERIYTLFTTMLNIVFIHLIWKQLEKQFSELGGLSWLAVLLWITIPVCFWSYSNCMHENTMSVFCLGSVYMMMLYYFQNPGNLIWVVLSGISVVLAFMSKGFPGLFPLGIPFLYHMIMGSKQYKSMLLESAVLFGVLLLFVIFIFTYSDAYQSIVVNYLEKRAFQRINSAPTVSNRFFIVWRLFSELIPAIIFYVLVRFSFRRKYIPITYNPLKKLALFFLLIGLSGSLPLLLTSVQKGFYMVASLPYFGIAFAIAVSPFLHTWVENLSQRYHQALVWTGATILLLSLFITMGFYGKTHRDQGILHDAAEIAKVIPKNQYLEIVNKPTFEDWGMQNYLMRHYVIGLSFTPEPYLLVEKGKLITTTKDVTKLELDTKVYDVYKKR